MDYSKKPENRNPRKDATSLSQLLFFWVVPLLYKGSRSGLTAENDLTKCLKKDRSENLADRLEK